MRRDGLFRQTAKQQLDQWIHAARRLAARHRDALPAYERLLWHVQAYTNLLHPSDRAKDNRAIVNAGLLDLALHHGDWIRNIELWHPARQNVWPLFSSLAQHLLARCPVPRFMTSVWLDSSPRTQLRQQEWYKHLGRGENIRTARLPISLTRAMVHWFSQAPHHLTAVQAIRWAQVRGLGGSKRLAAAVVGTRLGKVLENEDFWESVLIFFVNHPLDSDQIGPVVDFLQHQRFEWREGITATGAFGKIPPPQPQYMMKGRSAASLLRQVHDWHERLRKEESQPSIVWRHSPICDFRLIEGCRALGNMRVWTIRELLSTRALHLEGQAMRHCVASYGEDCIQRRTSIWSMQIENHRDQYRALTIEVDLSSKTICQMRGKCNRMPTDREQSIVQQWADTEGLRISEAL
ncbi:MAG TPA: PcfJ domain-containing protein [Gemmataceae bacterium]|nr:PcfJ domain-containing protein [Gemmataceae bacterium]